MTGRRDDWIPVRPRPRRPAWLAITPRLTGLLRGLALGLCVAVVYRAWFQVGPITAGDWPYVTFAGLRDMAPFPSLWNGAMSTGAYNILSGPMFPLQALQGLMSLVGVDWATSERLVWVFPALIVPCASTYALTLSLTRWRLAASVSALAVVMNSYAYLLYQGGQFTVVMGYGCMPLVVWAFRRGQQRGTWGSFVLTGGVMSIQALYDIRSTYITVAMLVLYGLIDGGNEVVRRARSRVGSGGQPTGRIGEAIRVTLWRLGAPHLAVALTTFAVIHLWWLLPALFAHAPELPAGYTDVSGVHGLSIMQLSNALALFHSFWFANNVHIYPINPLFFLAPLLIFSVLTRRRIDQDVVFWVVIALLAVFFVKGDNEPGGAIYDWVFVHVPGFSYFRDPSKFYQPLALAYAILLGVAVTRIARLVSRPRRFDRGIATLTALGFFGLATFPAYPALIQQAGGTFDVVPLPDDYARFNTFIDRQRDFFRVLWLPARPRYGTFSSRHPALDATTMAACCIRAATTPPTPDTDTMTMAPWTWLGAPAATTTLRALSIRYIVVPTGTTSADTVGQPRAIANMPPAAILASIRSSLPRAQEAVIGRLHVFAASVTDPPVFGLAATPAGSGARTCALGEVCFGEPHTLARVTGIPRPSTLAVESYATHGTSYDVAVDVTGPSAYLVLQQTFDPNWVAYVQGDGQRAPWATLFAAPLPAGDHVLANGYANAWRLPRHGRYHVVLDYWPQRLVVLGALVTVMIAALYAACVMRMARRRGKHMLSLKFKATIRDGGRIDA